MDTPTADMTSLPIQQMQNSPKHASSNSAAPSTFHGWLSLPRELQLMVLRNVLVMDRDPDTVDPNYHPPDFYALLHTYNHHLVDLAEDVYYKNNLFHVRPDDKGLSYPPRRKAHMIRSLSVIFEGCQIFPDFWDLFVDDDEIWNYVFHPMSPESRAACAHYEGEREEMQRNTRWTREYPDLKSVHWHISAMSHHTETSDYEGLVSEFECMLETIKSLDIHPKAPNVTALVKWHENDVLTPGQFDGEILRDIERQIVKMGKPTEKSWVSKQERKSKSCI